MVHGITVKDGKGVQGSLVTWGKFTYIVPDDTTYGVQVIEVNEKTVGFETNIIDSKGNPICYSKKRYLGGSLLRSDSGVLYLLSQDDITEELVLGALGGTKLVIPLTTFPIVGNIVQGLVVEGKLYEKHRSIVLGDILCDSQSSVQKVCEFHQSFGLPVASKVGLPESTILRESLIQEELNEFKEAVKNADFIEAVDALIDLQYVLDGVLS